MRCSTGVKVLACTHIFLDVGSEESLREGNKEKEHSHRQNEEHDAPIARSTSSLGNECRIILTAMISGLDASCYYYSKRERAGVGYDVGSRKLSVAVHFPGRGSR